MQMEYTSAPSFPTVFDLLEDSGTSSPKEIMAVFASIPLV